MLFGLIVEAHDFEVLGYRTAVLGLGSAVDYLLRARFAVDC